MEYEAPVVVAVEAAQMTNELLYELITMQEYINSHIVVLMITIIVLLGLLVGISLFILVAGTLRI